MSGDDDPIAAAKRAVWVDRRQATRGAPGRTHALVVGVSEYANLPAKGQPPDPDEMKMGLVSAETPCAGAFKFAVWLRDTYSNPYAPPASIRMLLAPSQMEMDADQDLAAAALPRPTRAAVERVILDWFTECRGDPNGVAILYISGH